MLSLVVLPGAIGRNSSTPTPTNGDVNSLNATLAPIPTPTKTVAPRDANAVTQPSVPETGSGSFKIADGSSARVGRGQLVSYQVEVEGGISVTPADFAAAVDSTLADRRGWSARGRYAFQRQSAARLRIVLATPSTTDRLCAPLNTAGEVSCRNGNVVAINAKRWMNGAPSYGNDIARYRHYVINHEVGHSLGLNHTGCPAPNTKAPVMLQQTLGLQGCKANPWPY